MPGMEERAPERTETSRGFSMEPKVLPGLLLKDAHVFEDIRLDLIVDFAVVRVVLGAGLSGDGEALGNRHTGVGSFGQVDALTTQSVLHGGLVAAEGVMAPFEQVQEFLAHSYLPNW